MAARHGRSNTGRPHPRPPGLRRQRRERAHRGACWRTRRDHAADRLGRPYAALRDHQSQHRDHAGDPRRAGGRSPGPSASTRTRSDRAARRHRDRELRARRLGPHVRAGSRRRRYADAGHDARVAEMAAVTRGRTGELLLATSCATPRRPANIHRPMAIGSPTTNPTSRPRSRAIPLRRRLRRNDDEPWRAACGHGCFRARSRGPRGSCGGSFANSARPAARGGDPAHHVAAGRPGRPAPIAAGSCASAPAPTSSSSTRRSIREPADADSADEPRDRRRSCAREWRRDVGRPAGRPARGPGQVIRA